MKKAIFTIIACVGICALMAVPEKISWWFVLDYPLRLIVLGLASKKLCELDKQKA